MAVGVDVGAKRLHVVALGIGGEVTNASVVAAADLADFESQLAGLAENAVVAIDGPAGPSVAAYSDEAHLSEKFRLARGCEIELGRQRKIWVSFATGPHPLTGWMAVAQAIHNRVQAAGFRALETYPHAVYATLLGSRPPKKTSRAGLQERVRLLRAAGVDDPSLDSWSHDGLDAAAAALVALHAYRGMADAVTSPRDGTAIWLPGRNTLATT